MVRRRLSVACLLAVTVVPMLTGCGSSPTAGHSVSVLYAGSLVNLMEKQVGPAFAKSSGDSYQGYGAASQAVANAIKGKVETGDVFISASPTVNASLEGPANGGWVKWYAAFATAPLLIGYNPESRFATALRTRPWYDVLQQAGIRIGITDPRLDPKGELTVTALKTAEQDYGLPATFAKSIESKAAVFPEEDLVGRLEAGQLDVGFFYSNEASAARIPTVTLGKVHEQATFTVTVLNRAKDAAAGAAFVRFLLTTGRSMLREAGLRLTPPSLSGDPTAVPGSLRSLLSS